MLKHLRTDKLLTEPVKKFQGKPEVKYFGDGSKNFVVKSNALIEARYRLSLQEAQVILWLLTQIRPEDEDFKSHKLNIAEFTRFTQAKFCNKHSELRKITRKLMQRVMEIHLPDEDKTTQFAWLSSAEYEHKKGHVLLEFSPKLKPYLLQLKSHFTKINVVDTLKLKSIYAIRIFELLLQYSSIGLRKITLENLREYCGIDSEEYKNYFDLKRYVIEKSKIEINSKTEYKIEYTEIKESRKVVAIEWIIEKRDSEKEKSSYQIQSLRKELRSELALIEEITEYGYSKGLSKKFIKVHGEDVVRDALKAVNIQIEKDNVKNPKAMLKIAIEEKWKPDIYQKKVRT